MPAPIRFLWQLTELAIKGFCSISIYEDADTIAIGEAPQLVQEVPDQIAVADEYFSYDIPDNTFVDPDGDTLNFSLQTMDAPGWLNFYSVTQTIWGTPTDSDLGTLDLRLMATDEEDNSSFDYFELTIVSNNDPTGNVTISGDKIVGEELNAISNIQDSDGLGSYSYQWFRSDVEIPGANSQSYTLTSADIGSFIRVEVSYIDGLGISEIVSSDPSSVVVPPRPVVATGSHTLSVIVDQDVLGIDPVLLKDLNESITTENGTIVEHTVEYNGTTFNYDDIDTLITTVLRDGGFTEEFREEISDLAPSFSGISYQDAITLIGVANIDATLVNVAGADGFYVA